MTFQLNWIRYTNRILLGVPVEIYYDTHLPNSLPYLDHGELYLFDSNTYTSVEIEDKKFHVANKEGVYNHKIGGIKLRNVLLLILVSIFLVGCQHKDDELITKEIVDTRPLYESNAKPREIQLRHGSIELSAEIPYYCWAKQLDECSDKLNSIYEEKLADLVEQPGVIGVPTELYFETYIHNPLPLPDRTELYIFENNTYTPVEIIDNKFYFPNEEGIFTYVYKTIFDSEDAQGIAFYTFKVRTRF